MDKIYRTKIRDKETPFEAIVRAQITTRELDYDGYEIVPSNSEQQMAEQQQENSDAG